MSLYLKDGDYVPDGNGGFVTLAVGEDILARMLLKLKARRGAFSLLPEFGSRLYRLPGEKASRRGTVAKQYVEEALADEKDLSVQEVLWHEETGKLEAVLQWQGARLPVLIDLERRR